MTTRRDDLNRHREQCDELLRDMLEHHPLFRRKLTPVEVEAHKQRVNRVAARLLTSEHELDVATTDPLARFRPPRRWTWLRDLFRPHRPPLNRWVTDAEYSRMGELLRDWSESSDRELAALLTGIDPEWGRW